MSKVDDLKKRLDRAFKRGVVRETQKQVGRHHKMTGKKYTGFHIDPKGLTALQRVKEGHGKFHFGKGHKVAHGSVRGTGFTPFDAMAREEFEGPGTFVSHFMVAPFKKLGRVWSKIGTTVSYPRIKLRKK